MQIEAYKLGEGYPKTQAGKTLYGLPYTVHYTPGSHSGEFYLASGDARNGNGTFLKATQVLSPTWRADLQTAGGAWLLPLIERMAQGEKVASSEVLSLYQQVHGKPPVREEWRV